MRFFSIAIYGCVAAVLCSGCQKQEPPKESEYKLTSPVREIMRSMVMPSADVVWNSVSSAVTEKGVVDKVPSTAEEWKTVRDSAITIMEATDLILMPGRRMAAPGEKEQDPNVNLSPEQIEARINQDRANWVKFAHDLHDAVLPVLKAIDAKDSKALSDAGAGIDTACENCHLKYWYPKDAEKK